MERVDSEELEIAKQLKEGDGDRDADDNRSSSEPIERALVNEGPANEGGGDGGWHSGLRSLLCAVR